MRFVLALLLAGCWFGVPGFGLELRELAESIQLNADGTGNVEIRALVNASGSTLPVQTFALPCSFKDIGPVSCAEMASVTATVAEIEGIRQFQVTIPPLAGGESRITLQFTAKGLFDPQKKETEDFGTIPVTYQHVNTLPQRIGSYSLRIILPEGQAVGGISEVIPKPGKNDPQLPYTLSWENQRYTVSMALAPMKTGDRQLLKFRLKSTAKPMILLAAGLVISLLYLYFFRDMVQADKDVIS